nr:hypothetical protein [Anaeromonas frigoriresistens]
MKCKVFQLNYLKCYKYVVIIADTMKSGFYVNTRKEIHGKLLVGILKSVKLL